MPNRQVNAIVVGTGAGGGVVAKELAVAGLSVVLFERGRWVSYKQHGDNELISQRTTVLGNGYGPDDRDYRRVVVESSGSTRIVRPSDGAYNNVAACVGSGTVCYGAMAWRFMPQDFKMRSTYGSLAGSTLEDWPITYDDLESCYEKAEWEIGVSGDDSQNPFAPPRKKPQPMPPMPYNTEADKLEAAAKRLGWHPFPIPMLRNSVFYGGRRACVHRMNCVGFACPIDAKNGTQNTVIPVALATRHCELRTESVVSEVMVDDHGLRHGREVFRRCRQAECSDRGCGRRLRLGHGDGPLAAEFPLETVPSRRGQQQRLGGPKSSRACLHRSQRIRRREPPRRTWTGGLHRLLRLQSRPAGLSRRRHVGQRVHRVAVSIHTHSPAGSTALGPRRQGLPAALVQAYNAHHGAGQKCPSSMPASKSIRPSRTIGASPSPGCRANGTLTTSRLPNSFLKRRKSCFRRRAPNKLGAICRAWASAAASTRRELAAWATTPRPR